MKTERIVMCGFMGSGKTTIGQAVAEKLGWEFIDMDDYIIEKIGMKVEEIFEKYGEPYFREQEHLAAAALAKQKNTVISTGGQVMTVPRNADLYRDETSLVVHLNPNYDVCYSRIKDSNRPLVVRNTRESLYDVYKERSDRYKAGSDVQVDNSGDPEEAVNNIISLLK